MANVTAAASQWLLTPLTNSRMLAHGRDGTNEKGQEDILSDARGGWFLARLGIPEASRAPPPKLS